MAIYDRNSDPWKQLQDHFKKIEQGFEESKDGETLVEKLLYSLSPAGRKSLIGLTDGKDEGPSMLPDVNVKGE